LPRDDIREDNKRNTEARHSALKGSAVLQSGRNRNPSSCRQRGGALECDLTATAIQLILRASFSPRYFYSYSVLSFSNNLLIVFKLDSFIAVIYV
jgi:hypothetical protein